MKHALLFGFDPKKWEPGDAYVSGDALLTTWPYSANAQIVIDATLPGTPFVLFNQDTRDVHEMGVVQAVSNVAPDAGWTADDDWEATGWKESPVQLSKTFRREGGSWLPLVPIGLLNVGITFPLADRALNERLDGKLYRRNPVVISMTAYGEIQRACHKEMVRWFAAQST